MMSLKELVANVLNVDPSEIQDDSSPQTIGTWDSFAGLMLVSELEQHYKVKFTSDDVTGVRCVADIKAALNRHGVTNLE